MSICKANTRIITLSVIIVLVFLITGCGGSQSKSSKSAWNSDELDISRNGNLKKALKMLQPLADGNVNGSVEQPEARAVKQKPQNYYGKIVKLEGQIIISNDKPSDENVSKELGGKAKEYILSNTKDATMIDFLYIGPDQYFRDGATVAIYGYPAGIARISGNSTALAVVGNKIELISNY
ncbi:MAG: hypothetical protein AB1743_05805 [Actinomycetota bacterium]